MDYNLIVIGGGRRVSMRPRRRISLALSSPLSSKRVFRHLPAGGKGVFASPTEFDFDGRNYCAEKFVIATGS